MKPKSEARSKYRADSFSSFEERTLDGAVAALWMLKAPATRYGCSRANRDDWGETAWWMEGAVCIGVADHVAGKIRDEAAL